MTHSPATPSEAPMPTCHHNLMATSVAHWADWRAGRARLIEFTMDCGSPVSLIAYPDGAVECEIDTPNGRSIGTSVCACQWTHADMRGHVHDYLTRSGDWA